MTIEEYHGTLRGYLGHGCRCERCRDAQRVYYGNRTRADYLLDVAAERYLRRGDRASRLKLQEAIRRAASAWFGEPVARGRRS